MSSPKLDFITLSDGSRLQWFEKKKEAFLNKTILLFGATCTGKSVIMDEIMNICDPEIEHCFGISPTNAANGFFTNRLPPMYYISGSDQVRTIKFLRAIIERQKNACDLYNTSTKLSVLRSLCERVSDEVGQRNIAYISEISDDSLEKIERSKKMNIAEKKAMRHSIEELRDNMFKKIYKSIIHKFQKELSTMKGSMSIDEKIALRFYNINPNSMLLLDDCASHFKRWFKEDTAIKELFYQGRQYKLTTVISSQDDKDIESELRKNAGVIYFTTAVAALETFDRASNHCPKHVRERAKVCVPSVFYQEPNTPLHYKKLVFLPNDSVDPFRFTIADLYDSVKMCPSVVWAYVQKKSKKKKDGINEHIVKKYIESY